MSLKEEEIKEVIYKCHDIEYQLSSISKELYKEYTDQYYLITKFTMIKRSCKDIIKYLE
jgi:galactitol-specific phosphotransferase system IIB component